MSFLFDDACDTPHHHQLDQFISVMIPKMPSPRGVSRFTLKYHLHATTTDLRCMRIHMTRHVRRKWLFLANIT